jgi:hypothetical protein
MNIGSLYLVKNCYWLLFSSARAVVAQLVRPIYNLPDAVHAVSFYSTKYEENVTYFSPHSHVVFLEEYGMFKKLLTSEGLIGWTWVHEEHNDCFEEVKQP